MWRQHDIGMRGGDGCIKDRAQERASVSHGFQDNRADIRLLIPPLGAKENPRTSMIRKNKKPERDDIAPRLCGVSTW
jgi:hypothetical protein